MRVINEAVESVPVGALRPHPRNPRQGDVGAIYESIEANGFYGTIVAQKSTGYILAGNHRWQAAQHANASEVPVVWVDVDDAAALRILLADNRTNDVASYNDAALAELLQDILRDAGTLEGTGYDTDALNELLADLGAGQETSEEGDVDLTPPSEPKSKRGEVYQLGPHRLMCGDSTSIDDVERLMDGDRAEVLWTDPPYGVNYVGKTSDALTIQNDGASSLPALLDSAFAAANAVMAPGARFYVACPAGRQHMEFRLALDRIGWTLHQGLIWVKDVFVLGHSDYHVRHEDILYGYKKGEGRVGRGDHEGTRWYGDHAQSSVFEVDRPKRNEEHPTMKPPELIRRQLSNSARRGDVVLDPFGGSGSTLIACDGLGLIARVMELDPRYCDVIRRRYAEFVGKPELAP